jgi:activating signal cointegrator complex subunit 3
MLEKMREGFSAEEILNKSRRVLPDGTKRWIYSQYDEVFVPPVTTATVKRSSLVSISTLDEWAQSAFEGYTHLNRIQSAVFDAAYNNNGNLLICSPTGSGKTNIALLAILHEICDHIGAKGTLIKSDAFKIIYIAPMKALAEEITNNFARRLSKLGVIVRELTGDMQLSKREIGDTHLIVTTPEKWDVITRKSNDSSLPQLVRLLIIDEIHLLQDSRGPVLETLVGVVLLFMFNYYNIFHRSQELIV